MPITNPRREILPIPAVLEPPDTICFCIELPDDREHLAAFWGALFELGKRYSWGKPLTADSETVAAYWRALMQKNYEIFEEVR